MGRHPPEFSNRIPLRDALRRNFTAETDRQLSASNGSFKPEMTYVKIKGPDDTFELVKNLIYEGRGHWDVIAFSREATKGVDERDQIGNIFTLFKTAQKNVKYQFDPFKLEMILPAQLILKYRDLGFDCDDIGATLLGSLLLSIGYRVQLVMGGKTKDSYSHIWVRVWLPKYRVWYPLDMTRKDRSPGWEMPHVRERTYTF